MIGNCPSRCLWNATLHDDFSKISLKTLRKGYLWNDKISINPLSFYKMLFYEMLFYEMLFYEMLFYEMLFYEMLFYKTLLFKIYPNGLNKGRYIK